MNQTIRIIGGRYRGKKLHFPTLPGLRPTPDRVRETLFNWLMHDIRNARCLDAFSGSGALGFEAFSRGASTVTLLENNHVAFTNLNKIATAFHAPNLQVIKTDAITYFKQCQTQFDIIFLDPPFANNYLPSLLTDLATNPILIQGGLVYVELSDQAELTPPLCFEKIHVKKAGQVIYRLYRKSLIK